jgi:hypothetical protein
VTQFTAGLNLERNSLAPRQHGIELQQSLRGVLLSFDSFATGLGHVFGSVNPTELRRRNRHGGTELFALRQNRRTGRSIYLRLSNPLSATCRGSPEHFRMWHVTTFRCAEKFGRYWGAAHIEQAVPVKLESGLRTLVGLSCRFDDTRLRCPTGKSVNCLSSPLRKNFPFCSSGKSSIQACAIPS